ncbi:MAG: PucR family transcriptional regulator ligand-binding domain-containing protein [Actinobacteria bacterium]|nr:PucR family transcriptional regulator ligand-binding domain-containing protein [Actinomycetota bacterium]
MEVVDKDSTDASAEVTELVPHLAADAPSLGMRVREVLAASTMSGARVLAGADGLDRVVRRLNVMEVPDILPWVKPHELLLTTGYPLREDPEALAGLVAALDDRGLAAMVIKLHRYVDAVSPRMLAEADRRGFPLIELPDSVGFDDVLNEVLGELLNRQAAVLARTDEVHRALVSVVLEGGGLPDLTAELTRILGVPVVITTPGSHPADPGGAAATRVPIVAGRVDYGRIVALSDTPLGDADVHCLERAATVAALAITKQRAVAAVESKYRAEFLRDLLTGGVGDLAVAVAHARSLGWDIDRPVVVVVAEPDAAPDAPADPFGPALSPVHQRFVGSWQSVIARRDPRAAVVNLHRDVVAVLAAPPDLDRLIVELSRQVRREAASTPSYSLGVSRVLDSPDALPRGYQQARTAARIGRQVQGVDARATFDRLGVYRLLSLIPDDAELRGFVDDVLGALAAEDPEHVDLRRTLSVLLETNCNVAQAARRLHFHYNTLRYRIGKLERMVGPFLTDPTLRLNLTLALRVLEMGGSRTGSPRPPLAGSASRRG